MAREKKDAPSERVQAQTDAAEDRGVLGVEVDPTPNENYTVAGVLSGAPTPETDRAAAQAATARRGELARDPHADEK